MNWSRGLLRLWIAFTILCVGGAAVALYIEYPRNDADPAQSTAAPSMGDWVIVNPTFKSEDPKLKEERRDFWKTTVPPVVMLAIGVPAGFFAAGLTLLWIGRGFRR